ncbi:hypothetical protein ACLOJK_031164 [Asimina triloba]
MASDFVPGVKSIEMQIWRARSMSPGILRCDEIPPQSCMPIVYCRPSSNCPIDNRFSWVVPARE